jgi:hypothetical protein
MSTLLSTPRAYINFALQLRAYVKNTVTEAQVKQTILEQVANREDNFIKILKTNVFEYPQSPYLPLFKAANMTHADMARMIHQQGLENTLLKLCTFHAAKRS